MGDAAITAVAELTGRRATGTHAIAGHVFAVELADGDVVVAKRHPEPSVLRAEVTSLAWLAESATVRLPAVLAADAQWVIMERVAKRQPSRAAAERLGRDLAALHRAGAESFGGGPPGGTVDAWIGRAPMRNEPGQSWPSWYAANRIEPYLRLAVDKGLFDDTSAAVIGDVCEQIEDVAGPPEPPARLHGDLWSGNVLWSTDAVLIDPAAHGGHRETDLAMLALFGCPHLDTIIAAYDEAAPLAPDWPARVPLHQLFPLLVHTVLFGASYAEIAVAAARAVLAYGLNARRGGRPRR